MTNTAASTQDAGQLPHMTDTHLKEALTLTLRIIDRYNRDKREFSDEEQALLSRLLAATDLSTAIKTLEEAPPERLVATSPTTRGGSLAGRMSHLISKLRNATSAAGMYKDLVSTKSDVENLTDFALGCSDLSLTAAQLAALVVKQIMGINSAKIESCSVYFADAIDEFVVDPLTNATVPIDDMTHVGRCALNMAMVTSGSKLYMPLHSGTTAVGVVELLVPESLDDHKMHILEATVSVASLSIRNQKLFEGLRWQHTKAEAMLEMATKLSRDNLDETILVQSIMNTAKQLTESDRCSIFLVRRETLQAYFEDGATVTMSIDTGIAGHVAKTGETVNIVDAYQDPRFNSSVDKATGYKTNSILCMPVLYEGSIVAVAQLINKLDRKSDDGLAVKRVFSKRDEELFSTFSTFTGVSLRNCRVNAELLAEKRKSEAILDVVTLLSNTDIRDVNKIVHHVMVGARKLLSADRASLFLVDKERNELYSTVADSTGGKEIRFPSGKGIAGVVAATGIGENIHDAYQDDRFNREIDKVFGYRTQSVLCEPITLNNEVLAVAQLVNKMDERDGTVTTFTAADQESFRTFALFAGISIANSHLLEFAVRAGKEAMELNNIRERAGMVRGESTVKLASITAQERDAVLAVALPEDIDVCSREFSLFSIRDQEDSLDKAVAVTMRVLQSTGLPQKFGCPETVLLNFVLQCRRKYRRVPYHNFYHVVDVCQTLYTFLYDGHVKGNVLTDLECYVLLITALVHDLDHMGVNNSFHLKTDSPLGILSSASGNNSVLEVHHCNLAIEILSDPESNVFIGLQDQPEITFAFRGLIDCVLATDMARHGELLTNYVNMVNSGFSKDNEASRRLVMMMILKAGDISNVTKPFSISRLWAVAVTEEFYQQGDMERAKGVDVLPMFDRGANNELAKGQLGFINFVAAKFFDSFATGPLEGLQWAKDAVHSNKDTWQRILDGRSNSNTKA